MLKVKRGNRGSGEILAESNDESAGERRPQVEEGGKAVAGVLSPDAGEPGIEEVEEEEDENAGAAEDRVKNKVLALGQCHMAINRLNY